MFALQQMESEILKCSVFVKMDDIKLPAFVPQGRKYTRTYKEPIGFCYVAEEKYFSTIHRAESVFDGSITVRLQGVSRVDSDFMPPFHE